MKKPQRPATPAAEAGTGAISENPMAAIAPDESTINFKALSRPAQPFTAIIDI